MHYQIMNIKYVTALLVLVLSTKNLQAQRKGIRISPDQMAEKIIAEADQNMDGMLSREEVSKAERNRLAQHFSEFDTNGDGLIDKEEFGAKAQEIRTNRNTKRTERLEKIAVARQEVENSMTAEDKNSLTLIREDYITQRQEMRKNRVHKENDLQKQEGRLDRRAKRQEALDKLSPQNQVELDRLADKYQTEIQKSLQKNIKAEIPKERVKMFLLKKVSEEKLLEKKRIQR